jgi:hypothetical protein
MASGLLDIMKRAAIDANEASQPTDLRFGMVTSTSPLKVTVTNQMVIPESLLIVPEKLTDYTIDVTPLDWVTGNRSGGGGDSAFSSHNHDITGRKQMIIHNALKVGDKVVLIRKQGGQAFYILDRI